MPVSKKVLVTGATGNIGSLLVPALVQSGVSVRALLRDEAKAETLRYSGVEVMIGDLDQPETLARAVEGVDTISLITWNGPTAEQQGKNVIEAALKAGRPHVVKASAYGSEGSRLIQQIEAVDGALVASGLPYTFIKPTFFMQNIMMAAQTISEGGAIYMPFKDGKVGMIDVRDVAEATHAVLTSEGHAGRDYVLTGPQSVSFHDVAKAFSETLGKEVSYVDVPPEAAKESMVGMGLPEWIVEGYLELFEGFAANWGDRTTGSVEQLTGHGPRSIKQFSSDFAAVFGGAATPAAGG